MTDSLHDTVADAVYEYFEDYLTGMKTQFMVVENSGTCVEDTAAGIATYVVEALTERKNND